ncbi:hypothetical protein ACPOL_6528 [Acidisarcina polymorpha]|uniref:Uncharacterized protein n=1 Tax=Acidisarcina polymorpha TaxID=2211140 RepID=A0A2Z5G9S0_9BACT|nr:hypothetical protein ACPOL_6528 [Acidisarcina polymorpha]
MKLPGGSESGWIMCIHCFGRESCKAAKLVSDGLCLPGLFKLDLKS